MAMVLVAIETQRRQIWESATLAIEKVEFQRDDELGRLDRAVSALGGERIDPVPRKTTPPAGAKRERRRRRRRAKCASTPEAARERREAVFRYLVERHGPVGRGQICRDLDLTPFAVRTALRRLVDEGRVVRSGTGAGTCYAAKGAGPAARGLSAVPDTGQRVLRDRILKIVGDRGYASPEELAQATGVPRDRIMKEGGVLLNEGKLNMDRRESRRIFVLRRAA